MMEVKNQELCDESQAQPCVIYARYSSHTQRDVSIEQQVADCEAYAKMNNLQVVKVYADRALSGTNDKRPEFQKMLRDAEKGRWLYVLCWKVDRFARNRYDSATYKYRLKRCGVRVLYAKESIPDGPEGILLESVLEGSAEYYSANLSQNIKRGMPRLFLIITILFSGGIFMLLEDMTWNEAKNYIENVNNNLILSVGTCEQHGYHLPLNNDILVSDHFAQILSERTGALLAPTINYGVNLPCDKYLAGTTSITKDILRNMLISLTDWWHFQGIKNIVIITYHGDPFHLEAMQSISPNIMLCDISEVEYSDILERQATIRHACEAETSVALYLYPEKVKRDQIKEHNIEYDQFKDYLFHQNVTMPEGYVGCLGYPSAATAEKGKMIVDRMIKRMFNACVDTLTSK